MTPIAHSKIVEICPVCHTLSPLWLERAMSLNISMICPEAVSTQVPTPVEGGRTAVSERK